MEMHCTFRITCRNMQLFTFAALSMKCTLTKSVKYFRCQETRVAGEDTPSE